MKKGGLILSGIASLMSISFVSAAFSITNVLNTWADAGIFAYVLPFLLIFALVFGILDKIKILGENKAVNAIIALALGLLALVGDYVPNFFQTIAPNLGIALSVLLAAIILGGLFMAEASWVKNAIIIVGVIAFLIVVFSSFSSYPASAYNLWDEYGPALTTLLILGGIIGLIVYGGKK